MSPVLGRTCEHRDAPSRPEGRRSWASSLSPYIPIPALTPRCRPRQELEPVGSRLVPVARSRPLSFGRKRSLQVDARSGETVTRLPRPKKRHLRRVPPDSLRVSRLPCSSALSVYHVRPHRTVPGSLFPVRVCTQPRRPCPRTGELGCAGWSPPREVSAEPLESGSTAPNGARRDLCTISYATPLWIR